MNVWLAAVRPKTLIAAIAPVAVGSACAHAIDGFRVVPALAALTAALLFQVGANLANDYYDARSGADAVRIGPTRAVAAGLVSPRAMRRAFAFVLLGALAPGIVLVSAGGAVIAVLGVASVAAALAYTGGPWPLGYHGLGEATVIAFFGFVATCGTVLVEAGRVPAIAWPAALAVGALAAAILGVNNLRDRVHDTAAGKRTLATRVGRRGAIVLYVALVAAAYVAALVLAFARPAALLVLATLPIARACAVRVARDDGRALDGALAATARLLGAFALALAIGIAL